MKEKKIMSGPVAGDEITATIESVAFGGAGIARQDGLVLFIPFTAPGDTVEAIVNVRKKHLAECRLKRIIIPSPSRIKAPCPHFGKCGGCQYQHISYPEQLRMKEQQVRDLYARIAGMPNIPLAPMIGSPQEYKYRIKADFNIKKKYIGFVSIDNNTVIDIESCMIMTDKVNEQYAEIRDRLHKKEIQVESHYITLWDSTAEESPLAENKTPDFIQRKVLDKTFTVPYFSFFQANASLTGAMVQKVVELCEPKPSHIIADCYCGCGLFSLFLAEKAGKVNGIESTRASINSAREFVSKNGVTNVEFFRGNVEKHLPRLIEKENIVFNSIVIDPPRCGCDRSVLDTLVNAKPARIVYVSCNPSTQARDAAILKEKGYKLETLQPFDMFPQTKHMELVAQFVKE